MAAAMQQEYGQGAVYGSLAYDFNNPELYREEYSVPQTPTAQPKERTQTRVRTRSSAKTKQSIAPLSVAGVLVAALLFVVSITAQIQLFDISTESVKLSTQLSELETEQARLRVSYESAFNLTEIEEYAMNELGMQKPSADQIYYIDTSAPDKAVVVADNGSRSFVDRTADFLSGIRAYFG